MGILIIPIFLILMYVALLRPQQQRVRRQQQLVTSIGIGDEVVTAGGLIGRVVGLTDDRLELEVAEGVVIELLRMAISRRLEAAPDELDDSGPMDDSGRMDEAGQGGDGQDGDDRTLVDSVGGAEATDHDQPTTHQTTPAEPQSHLPPDPDSP